MAGFSYHVVKHDLLVITPTRGRPAWAKRLIEAINDQSRGTVHVALCVDEDDPKLDEYRKIDLRPFDVLHIGPRKNLVEWTNHVAVRNTARYKYMASLGDDHVPRTPGWDARLIRVIEGFPGGTGFAYPHDGVRDDVPEAVVVSTDIIEALGWFMLPDLTHYWVDNVWLDLGKANKCIKLLRGVYVEHLSPMVGKAPADSTHLTQAKRIPQDQAAYKAWRRSDRYKADCEVIKHLVPQRTLVE